MANRWNSATMSSEEEMDGFSSHDEEQQEEPRIPLNEYHACRDASPIEESCSKPVAVTTGGHQTSNVSAPVMTSFPRMPMGFAEQPMYFGIASRRPIPHTSPMSYPTRFTSPGDILRPPTNAPPPPTNHRGSPTLIVGYSPLVQSDENTTDDGWLSDGETQSAAEHPVDPDFQQELLFQEQLLRMRRQWMEGKDQMSPAVRSTMLRAFRESPNAYHFLCYVVCSYGGGGAKGSHSLPRALMAEFQKWKSSRARTNTAQLTCSDLRRRQVLQYMALHYPHYTNDLFAVFSLRCALLEDRLAAVREALEASMFKDAAFFAQKLDVREHFSVKRMLLPLIALDKVNIIQPYLDGVEALQREFVGFLSDSCSRGHETVAILNRELSQQGVFEKDSSKLTIKQMEKMASRLIKRYELSVHDFPHFADVERRKHLHFLLVRRYKLREISEINMDDMLMVMLKESSEQEQLMVVLDLMRFGDAKAAARLARRCGLRPQHLPSEVQQLVLTGGPLEVAPPTPSLAPRHHQLSLPRDSVRWVDSEETLDRCRQVVARDNQIVGLDAEWRMVSCNLGVERVALLQLATAEAVYLLDTLALKEKVKERVLRWFMLDLLANDKVLKLGYGVDGDMRMLAKSWTFAVDIFGSPKRMLDLQLFVPQLEKVVGAIVGQPLQPLGQDVDGHPPQEPQEPQEPQVGEDLEEEEEEEEAGQMPTKKTARGLSALVQKCFGLPLNKMEQLSDWEKRPLREEQVLYAALDAHCLLEVYQYLLSQARAVDPQFDPAPYQDNSTLPCSSAVCQEEKEEALRLAQAKAKGQPLVTNPPKKPGPLVQPRELRVVADNMFQGLARNLRMVGVDSKSLPRGTSPYQLLKVSVEEGRVVLTSGKSFHWARNKLPPGLAYHVDQKQPQDQLREVLQYFNVKVKDSDILSRCQVCNSDSFAIVSSQDMQDIFKALPASKIASSESDSVAEDSPVAESSPVEATQQLPCQSSCSVLPPRLKGQRCRLGRGVEVRQGKAWLAAGGVAAQQGGVAAQLEGVPRKKVQEVDTFYLCQDCGKVYWEGGHFNRTLKHCRELYM